MFAIVQTGGKQYKVAKGDTLELEKLDCEAGKNCDLKEILLVNDGSTTQVGMPFVEGAVVQVKVLDHNRGDKIRVFKMKPKKRYQKTFGHRQSLTTVEVIDIKVGKAKATPAKKAEKKEEEKAAA